MSGDNRLPGQAYLHQRDALKRKNIILTNLVSYKTFPKGKGRMFFTLGIH